MPRPVVFISYSQDSDEHREKVLGLAERLRQDGLDSRLDQYINGTPEQGWPRWMLDQLDEAGFVLVVCTETNYRRFRGHEEPGRGKGADWEGALITQKIYDARSRTVKIVPVMLAAGQERFIPEPLRLHTHYELTSEERYQALYGFLRGQAGVEPAPLGEIKSILRHTVQPLTFGSAARPTMIGVPHRNPYFTGREELLSRLHQQLQMQGISALAQAAIYGLGGIGKTQTAIEYAHRFGLHYRFVLWVVAESETALRTAYLSIARELGGIEAQANFETAVLVVKAWLSREDNWLLVFDNADDPALVRPFLPSARTHGKVLLTSRAKSFVSVGIKEPFRVETLSPEDSVKFLIDRTGNVDAQAAAELATELGYLPLALEQAAAYIENVGSGFAEYLGKYRRQGIALLKKGKLSTDYPKTIATTWTLSFDAVRKASPASATLLTISAFLVPDSIPIELFTLGHRGFFVRPKKLRDRWRLILYVLRHFGRSEVLYEAFALSRALMASADDNLVFWELLEPLERYSLVERLQDNTFRMHRLTQEVIKNSFDEVVREAWVELVIKALSATFPPAMFENWKLCERLLAQAKQALELTRSHNLVLVEAGGLFNEVGHFASDRGDRASGKAFMEFSLKIAEHVLGSDHQYTLMARNNLAAILQALGDLAGARRLQEETLEIQKRVLGSEHPDTLLSMQNLATTFAKLGDLDHARKLHEQALESGERVLGKDHPTTLSWRTNLATNLGDLGDAAGARKLYEKTLEVQERMLGGEHPDTLRSRDGLANLLRALGDAAGARKLHEQILEIRQRVLGDEHPDTLMSRNNLALTLRALGDVADARKLHEQVLEIRERLLGSEHPETLMSRHNLAVTLDYLEDLAGARKLHEQTLEVGERVLGSEHPFTTNSAWSLLLTVHKLNDPDSEAQLFDKLRWLLDRDVDSIPSAHQRSIRRELLNRLNPS